MKDTYAIATVVNREAPVSSHVGDRAIIYADGQMEGFIGGSCSRDIVRSHALMAIRSGNPRLVRIRPDAPETQMERDVVTVPMGCVSEGAVDVYIEPHVPQRQLLLAGSTPISDALAQMGSALNFTVVRFMEAQEIAEAGNDRDVLAIESVCAYVSELDGGVRARSVAVAASQGHYDERALAGFLQADLAFVGLVASPKRAARVAEILTQENVSEVQRSRVHSPVGLAIGARKPAEVAVSIFAQIIEVLNESAASAAEHPAEHVCHMHHTSS